MVRQPCHAPLVFGAVNSFHFSRSLSFDSPPQPPPRAPHLGVLLKSHKAEPGGYIKRPVKTRPKTRQGGMGLVQDGVAFGGGLAKMPTRKCTEKDMPRCALQTGTNERATVPHQSIIIIWQVQRILRACLPFNVCCGEEPLLCGACSLLHDERFVLLPPWLLFPRG